VTCKKKKKNPKKTKEGTPPFIVGIVDFNEPKNYKKYPRECNLQK